MIAKTTAGPVAGVDKGGIVQFRSIPYARADRFGPPGPVEAWNGTRECRTFGPIAPQNPFGVEAMLAGGLPATSEDCLTLNVFTPTVDDLARPVLVWVHGGAFTAGSGTMPWYNGSRLVAHGDVVVVTFNYRLGALGFLALDAFPGSGNNGLRDQVAALEWVRDNVAAFGGDPGNVTLFGESAGAMSIGALLGAPAAAGLFHRAILQSGAAENVHRADRAAWVTERFLAAAGAGAGHGGSDGSALVDRSVDELLAAQAAVSAEVSSAGGEFLPFTPVVDGLVLPRHPLDAVRAGAAAEVRVLAGTTADEWNLFALSDRNRAPLDEEALTPLLARAAGADRAEECLALYRSSRREASPDQLWSAVLTDWVFRMPAIRLLEAQAAHQRATWMYLFTYRSTAFDGVLGACHTIDVPFVFDNVGRRGVEVLLGAVDDKTRALSTATSQAWLAMARRGSPSHTGLPEWPSYSPTRRAVMGLGRTRQVLDDPAGAERRFWESVAPA